MAKQINHARVTIPAHPFFYTLDQVALMMSQTPSWLRARIFFLGRSTTRKTPTQLEAMNVAEPDQPADWRIDERELLRWLARLGYQVDRG